MYKLKTAKWLQNYFAELNQYIQSNTHEEYKL